ncbi:MAG: hypothetical protein ACP5H7_00750, partial [Minisyncoccia bacterium]
CSSRPVECCSDSDCPSSGSCYYGSWQDIGCGKVGCAPSRMAQKRVSSNPSYKKYSCSNYTCVSQTVNCEIQYRCLDTIACGANTEIQFSTDTTTIDSSVSITAKIDAGVYGVCEDDWKIKINNVETSNSMWDVSTGGTFTTYSGCSWYSWCNDWAACRCKARSSYCGYCESDSVSGSRLYCYYDKYKNIKKDFYFKVPGDYIFSINAHVVASDDDAYISTTSLTLKILAKYGQTADGDPIDVSFDKDVKLGNPKYQQVVDSNVLLGSQKGTVTIVGNLNLAANADPNQPIRIIYGKELKLAPGVQILLPDPSDPSKIGGAYIIKAGNSDPYASNTPASICNVNYKNRKYNYCGINKICNEKGECVDAQLFENYK